MKIRKEYMKPETDMARYIARSGLLVTSWGTKKPGDNPFEQQGGVKDHDDEDIDDWGGSW